MLLVESVGFKAADSNRGPPANICNWTGAVRLWTEQLLVTRGTLSALNSFMFSFLETVDSGWQYETGVDNDGTPPRTKRRLENSARAQSAGKRRQLHQVVRVQSHAWRGTRLRGRLGPLNRT